MQYTIVHVDSCGCGRSGRARAATKYTEWATRLHLGLANSKPLRSNSDISSPGLHPTDGWESPAFFRHRSPSRDAMFTPTPLSKRMPDGSREAGGNTQMVKPVDSAALVKLLAARSSEQARCADDGAPT